MLFLSVDMIMGKIWSNYFILTSILKIIIILKGSRNLSNKKAVKQVSGRYSQWYFNIALWEIPTLALSWHLLCHANVGISHRVMLICHYQKLVSQLLLLISLLPFKFNNLYICQFVFFCYSPSYRIAGYFRNKNFHTSSKSEFSKI